jgi:hypothetical protein
MFRDDVEHQRLDVIAAVAQRRHFDLPDVDAIQEVFAERALGDHVLQVAIGRGDHAHVHARGWRVGAHRHHFAVLEEAQQHRLHAQAHLADFVEEDGALVGLLQLPHLVAIGAGEAALHVAEELALEQRLGDAGAVERDEALWRARGVHMHVAGDDVLADAALAGDEHLGVAGGEAPGDVQHALQCGTAADDGRCGQRSK